MNNGTKKGWMTDCERAKMDLFTSMRVFTRVVEAGSLTSAAERSDISTTMVSKHVRYLEERLGTSLILRTTRRQTVTSFGKLYYDKCVEILEGIQALENTALEGAQEAKGILRISISRSFGASAFMGQIGEFMTQYPGIAVDLRIADSVFNLVEAGLDAAIRLGELPDSELIAKRLGTYRLWVCAAPSYLEMCDRPRTPPDLKNLDCLCFSYAWASEWHGREREWRFLGQNGPEVVEVRGRLMMNDASALHKCVLRGMGIVSVRRGPRFRWIACAWRAVCASTLWRVLRHHR